MVTRLSLKVERHRDTHHQIVPIYRRYKSGNKEKVQKKEQLEADSSGVWKGNP
jgi:hypothetical protein